VINTLRHPSRILLISDVGLLQVEVAKGPC
jgi:hypothetical protein